ncbi:hypothetical protein N0V88_006733 [Collariella sp. IMI 366227]|nr:hypothetical protein N0V88_006733 [Collariella sp. IMI 366227]
MANRRFGGLGSVVTTDYAPGYVATWIQTEYRSRPRFNKDAQGWYAYVLPRSWILVSARVLLYPTRLCSQRPCDCPQDPESILYNANKKPIGLMGGFSFLPDRLKPAGVSCCQHYQERRPIVLAQAHDGCTGCPFIHPSEDLPAEHFDKGPCEKCFLVNPWAELLMFTNSRLYARRDLAEKRCLVNPPLAAHDEHYPTESPLRAHLRHQLAILGTSSGDKD